MRLAEALIAAPAWHDTMTVKVGAALERICAAASTLDLPEADDDLLDEVLRQMHLMDDEVENVVRLTYTIQRMTPSRSRTPMMFI